MDKWALFLMTAKRIDGNNREGISFESFWPRRIGNPISEGNYAKEQLERYLLKIGIGANQTKATALLVFYKWKSGHRWRRFTSTLCSF